MYFFVWCWGYNCRAYKRKFTVYTGAQQLNLMMSTGADPGFFLAGRAPLTDR